jgi:cystathionine beta-lyase/cystathionine gamma-synthase
MARGIGTRAVHGLGKPEPGSLTTPIVQSATFVFESSRQLRQYLDGDEELFLYTRYENPTLRALEEAVAALENAEAGLVLASGMAAATTGLLSFLEAGDEVLASASLYGGTSRLVREVLPRLGIAGRVIPPAELAHLGDFAGPRSRVLVVESPTNPSLEVVDLRAVCAAAHDRGLAVMVDNTFATPVLQQPLALGADLVMHSLTKALSGHSDLIGGALVGSRERIERARSLLKVLGGCLDPHAAFLALRGIKTLHLRVHRQCENALALAVHLENHPKVARVIYPGLRSHPGYETARLQMSGFGGLVSFVLHGGLPAAEHFFNGLDLMARAASLGGVETLVSLPVYTSHYGYTPDQLAAAGVDPGTVRVSLGIEDAADLLEDADRALSRV